jgi:hypothetical protein
MSLRQLTPVLFAQIIYIFCLKKKKTHYTVFLVLLNLFLPCLEFIISVANNLTENGHLKLIYTDLRVKDLSNARNFPSTQFRR